METYFPSTWGKIPSFLKQEFTKDFEGGMHTLVTSRELSRITPLLMRNMAEYFVEFRPTSDNNLYVRLLNEIKPIIHVTGFSTLNYDILFEHAASRNGLSVSCFDEAEDKILFLKLHGSCNFIPPKGIEMVGNIFDGYRPFIGYRPREASTEETIYFCNSNTSVSPSMCLYTKLKKAQFANSEINRLRDLWKEWVTNTEKILIIGTKWYKEDTHLWESLSNTTANVGFIGSKSSFQEWTEAERDSNKTQYIGREWSDTFESATNFLMN